jgi:hypothetical protein
MATLKERKTKECEKKFQSYNGRKKEKRKTM